MTNQRSNTASHHSAPTPTRHHRRYGLVLGIITLGMLFWARILIIADIPRTAIADDPEENSVQAPDICNEPESDAQDSPSR